MKHHTFVCGSSKSKEQDAYYIYHNNRFWGTLHEVGLTDEQLSPEEYRRLGREYGIYLTEVVDPEEYRVAKDSDIKSHQVEEGLAALDDRIDAHEPNRLAFVGKNAATWFYRYIEGSQSHTRRRQVTRGTDVACKGWNSIGTTRASTTSYSAIRTATGTVRCGEISGTAAVTMWPDTEVNSGSPKMAKEVY